MRRKPTIRQLRKWERRAATLARKAQELTSDMIEAVGVEFEMAGENLTGQADDVVASADNLTHYLETCADIVKALPPPSQDQED